MCRQFADRQFSHSLRLNTEVYTKCLEEVVLPWVMRVAARTPYVWQQVSAPYYTIVLSVSCLSTVYRFHVPREGLHDGQSFEPDRSPCYLHEEPLTRLDLPLIFFSHYITISGFFGIEMNPWHLGKYQWPLHFSSFTGFFFKRVYCTEHTKVMIGSFGGSPRPHWWDQFRSI